MSGNVWWLYLKGSGFVAGYESVVCHKMLRVLMGNGGNFKYGP